MTGRERRLLRMLCMTASGGGGGGDKPWEAMTWDDVIAATKNGKYKNFEIGAMKELDLGSEGIVHMQIVGIDADELADGSGKAPLTFISKELLNSSNAMGGAWSVSSMRRFLQNTVKTLVPAKVAAGIKEVKKYSYVYSPQTKNLETSDELWIPSYREVYGGTSYESLGPIYQNIFKSDASRIKSKIGSNGNIWFLRSQYKGTGKTCAVDVSGKITNINSSAAYSIALGFCL